MSCHTILPGVITNVRRLARLVLLSPVLLLGAQAAWAVCNPNALSSPRVINIDMGKVLVPADLALNAVIASKSFQISGFRDSIWLCRFGTGTIKGRMLKGSAVTAGSATYTTTLAGVGIRVSIPLYEPRNYYPFDVLFGPIDVVFGPGEMLTVDLIKIGAVTGEGTLAAGVYTQTSSDGSSVSMLTTTMTGTGTTIIRPSCAVDLGSRNIPVSFGKVPQSAFKSRGSTTGDRSFNIRLNCNAGPRTVQIKMDAIADPSKEEGVLSITHAAGTNTASGVGIQIVNGTTRAAVKFGDSVDVGPSKEGSYVLPYIARYYQTGDKVTPGQANGTATFTLDYK